MKAKPILFMVTVALVWAMSAPSADGSPVALSVATDRGTYSLGENITVLVTAHNLGQELVTLVFPTSLQASYIMDDLYDWSYGKPVLHVITEVTIPGGSSHTWDFDHSWDEYALSVGLHTVVGEVVRVGLTDPVTFEVIPEPAALSLLAVGGLSLLRRKRR